MDTFDSVIIRLTSEYTRNNKYWRYTGTHDIIPVIPEEATTKQRVAIMRAYHGRYAEWVSRGDQREVIRVVEKPDRSVVIERL